MEAGVDFVTPMPPPAPPPSKSSPVVLITNELAIQSVALGLPSVYVDAQCDEGSHLFPVTDLSLTRPLEPKAVLILASNSRKDVCCDQRGMDRKKEKKRRGKIFTNLTPCT